jgi:membrane associated rhomboid family serine protease
LGANDVDLPPALERRVRDFKFAQSKRGERHGDNKPWGIFGLYAHLSDIRADLEWAEDAAWRRQRGEPYLSWSDFEKSRDKGIHNRPLFTYGIIFLCTIMLFVTFAVNDWKIEPLNVNPLIGPSSDTLVKCGARQTNLIVNEGEWYRLFSPMLLHAGLIHYIINMLAIWYIGGAVEQSHGFASAAVLFIIPAVGGNILSAICLPQYISVGASGGIFGLIGACVADISINWNLLFLKTTTDEDTRMRHVMVIVWLGVDIFLNCLIGLTPFVDNFTHLGGFMYGLCCGLSTIERLAVDFFGLSSGKSSRLRNTLVRFFGLIISVVTIMVTTVLLVQSDGMTSPCHGCRYISCVPFPPSSDDKWWYCDDCDFVTADLFVAANGSGLYEQIELNCPNGDVEEIMVAEDGLTDKEAVRKELPSYCRAHCDDVFIAH